MSNGEEWLEASAELERQNAHLTSENQTLKSILAPLAAMAGMTTNGQRQGVKLTLLASGKTSVEVHAFADNVHEAGAAARAEYDSQMGMMSIPADQATKLQMAVGLVDALFERYGEVAMLKLAAGELTLTESPPQQPPHAHANSLDPDCEVCDLGLCQGIEHRHPHLGPLVDGIHTILYESSKPSERSFDPGCQACQISAFNRNKAG